MDNVISLFLNFGGDFLYIVGIYPDDDFKVAGHGCLLAGHHAVDVEACVSDDAGQLLDHAYFVHYIQGDAGLAVSQSHYINEGLEYIGFGDDAHYGSHAADYRQAAELFVVHYQGGFLDGSRVRQGNHILCHDFSHGNLVQQAHDFELGQGGGRGRGNPHDVPVADDAHQAALFHYGQAADISPFHQLGGLIDGGGGLYGNRIFGHAIGNEHI